jgi:hypothetical protein
VGIFEQATPNRFNGLKYSHRNKQMTKTLDRKDKTFIGIILLVHVLFFILARFYKHIYMGDSFEYIYEALNIRNHLFFYSGNPAMPIMPEYMTQRQPLYPLFLLGVYLFSINNWIVLILQNALSICNIWYTRKVLLNVGYNNKYDWLLLLLVVAYPSQFINANTIAPDILLQTFTLLYAGSFIRLFQKKQLIYAMRMSLFLICGFLVKPILYPFVIPHIIILLIATARHSCSLQRLLLVAIVPLCAVLAYNYWNYTRTDKFHFSSNQAFNAVFYYYPYVKAQYGKDSAEHFLMKERLEIAAIPEYKDQYDYANSVGVSLLKDNFISYMLFHLKHSARIFIEPGKAEMDLFTGRLTYGRLYNGPETGFYATWKNKGMPGMGDYLKHNPSMPAVILVLLFNCIRLIGLILFFFSRRIHWLIRSFIFILVSYFAVAAGPIANTRYFLPVSLLVIGCAIIGFMNRLNKNIVAKDT